MIQTESAGGVVLNQEGLILVVSQHGRSWSLPKGHIEEGEDKIAAAKREIYEESGVKELILIKELGSYQRYKIGLNGENRSELKTIYFFLFKTLESKLNPIDPHNPEARWVSRSEVVALLTHPKDKEFFTSVLNLI